MKRSVIFWNVLFLVGIILAAIFATPIFWLVMFLTSIFSIVTFLYDLDSKVLKNRFSTHINPGTLLILIIGGIIWLTWYINEYTIKRFNKWLDS